MGTTRYMENIRLLRYDCRQKMIAAAVPLIREQLLAVVVTHCLLYTYAMYKN